MSSNHTLVSSERWRNIQRDISCAEAYVINRKEEAERLSRLAEKRRRELEQIQTANRRTIQNAVNSLRNMYTVNANRLASQADSHLQEQVDGFGIQIDAFLSEINAAKIQVRVLDDKINDIAGNFNDVFQEWLSKENNVRNRSNTTMNELNSLIERIEDLSPQRFSPAEYEALVTLRSMINTNISAGDYQAAIMVSQSSILNASRLLVRLVAVNEGYNAEHTEVCRRFEGLKERIERLSSKDGVLIIDCNGEEQEYDYDISFWSDGQFDNIVSDAMRIETLLTGGELTQEQLRQIADDIEILDGNLSTCDELARKERAGAIAASDTSVQLYSALTACGWTLVESGYNSDDKRNPYAMIFEDGSGNIASIVVAPESPQTPSVAIEVFSDDEEIASVTKDGVQASLEEEDICIESSEHRDDCQLNPDADTFIANATEEAMEYINQRRQYHTLKSINEKIGDA